MMKLCFLSLLIEDVIAIGGFKALGMDTLAGKATSETNTSVNKKKEENKKKEADKDTKVKTSAPISAANAGKEDGKISCGGHDADSCGACITAPGAPSGKEAASWCNGDCYVAFSSDVASCKPTLNGFVSCGHHQAADCETCTNEAVGGGLFCNGVCAFDDKTNKCKDS